MADSREMRQQELARLLLQKARQDLNLVVNIELPIQSSPEN